MEEVINKSDGQFKDILDDLVDYSKHSSKKDPLIKELSRPKPNSTKPPASINSSTYSSAASSASDSSTHSSSSSSSSTSSSASSSKSSSPSQSQVSAQNGKNQSDYGGMVEMAKMEDLGKTAKILEHRLPSVLRTVPIVVATSNPSYVSNYPLNGNKKYTIEEYNTINGGNDTNNENESGPNSTLNLTAQKYAPNNSNGNQLNLNGVATTSGAITSTAASSWKTYNTKRDKRRKKPVERKILAKEIPGHRGDQTVEELTKFIESRTNGTPTSSHNKNNKNKPQNSSNGTSNNSNQQNIGSNNNNTTININNNTTNNNNNNSNTNNSININNTNNSTKKNESHQINNKPSHTSTKMSNNIQPRSPSQPLQPSQNQNQQQPTMPQNSQPQSKQQIAQNEQTRETQLQKSTNKPSPQSPPLQQPKHAINHAIRQPQRRIQQAINGQQQPSPQQPVQKQIQKQANKFQINSAQNQIQEAVTFAEHIPLRDDDVIKHYTFGFFEDQLTSQLQQTKSPNINQNSFVNSTRKQPSQPQPSKNEQKQKLKQSKASPNSEENCYKSNDNIDSPSFNYEQILKFISSAWESTQAQLAASQNHSC